ncbi:DUF493 domain-containing protein [Allofranklinella schreckenbergeri]|uniref:UPF0250 protein EBQ24_11350 n=1 Tax=Allofranklinella schreckenbergeri TaxID=1076744 RepID=A0A3M6Q162_9BURK|nr:DUF493 domain-containing protein [Allofranklinella schreckenbergeri]RMW95097.1 DUF493 domain-containing protein [Allofranklinella schreckenbergeri]RMW97009.1 DUF493 domain-containing protein [Allofranklinella schreckenbergeri]RMX06223.1 DUF493 domain-containing protein [Allofranklinella schreckenbergeri]
MSNAQESIIEYPLEFPIKVMGLKSEAFIDAVKAIAARHDTGFDPTTVELRESREGKYLSVTITITATSREHLDGIYQELTAHPLSKMVF